MNMNAAFDVFDDYPKRLGTAIGQIEALLEVIADPALSTERHKKALHERWIGRAQEFLQNESHRRRLELSSMGIQALPGPRGEQPDDDPGRSRALSREQHDGVVTDVRPSTES